MSGWPADLIDEINRAHEETPSSSQDSTFSVFVVAHERKRTSADSEYIIEGVYSTLEMANRKTMEIFKMTHPQDQYPPSAFYARGVWESIGPNSVGWYVSSTGTLFLEAIDQVGSESRIYAEKHEVE